MASVISKVTELDKQMRIKVKELEEEKAKLPVFLREQRKDLAARYEAEAKEQIKERKSKIETELKDAKNRAKADLESSIKEIQKTYDQNKNVWLEEIYQECMEGLLGE